MSTQPYPQVKQALNPRRQRSTKTRLPDGGEIVRRRLLKGGWSQEDLLGAIALLGSSRRAPVSQRTLQTAESGTEYVKLSKLEFIARALDCDVHEIVQGDLSFQVAMMDEVFKSAEGKLGRPGGLFWRLLQALDSISDDAASGRIEMVDERELLLALAVRRDISGDSAGAVRLGQLVLREAAAGDSISRRATIRLATFYDHVARPERGLALLGPITRRRTGQEDEPELSWAKLQKGILLFRSGKVRKGIAVLKQLRESAPSEAHRTAALHQLSVAAFARGDLQGAKEGFELCIKEREQRPTIDFRLGYEYSRLAQVCDALGQTADALVFSRKADAILHQFRFVRYVRRHHAAAHRRRRSKVRRRS